MKKFKPKITIGIPAYNEEANIKNLLLNLLRQKSRNFSLHEMIICSDGSTDRTVSIIKSIKNNKIKLIIGDYRKGQNFRLNQILGKMSEKSDYLLILEADEVPADYRFIENIVIKIPNDKKFSVIMSNSVPIKAKGYFEKIVNYGFSFRKELFEKANNEFNLYLSTSAKLLSREFLKNFRWDDNFHEDSFCYRKVLESKLPMIRATKAKIYFKSVTNLRDYLLQSGKFQKARAKESEFTNTYELKINTFKLISISLKYFFRNPYYLINYVLLLTVSRIYSLFLPEYNVFWGIYKSSKVLVSEK